MGSLIAASHPGALSSELKGAKGNALSHVAPVPHFWETGKTHSLLCHHNKNHSLLHLDDKKPPWFQLSPARCALQVDSFPCTDTVWTCCPPFNESPALTKGNPGCMLGSSLGSGAVWSLHRARAPVNPPALP